MISFDEFAESHNQMSIFDIPSAKLRFSKLSGECVDNKSDRLPTTILLSSGVFLNNQFNLKSEEEFENYYYPNIKASWHL